MRLLKDHEYLRRIDLGAHMVRNTIGIGRIPYLSLKFVLYILSYPKNCPDPSVANLGPDRRTLAAAI